MNIPLSLFLDVFIAVLLIVTIGYALTLNKRLSMLRKDKEDLQKLALSFGDATTRAEVSIAELGVSINVLQERINRAETLREDLVFLVERGNGTADTLEELLRNARDNIGVMPRPPKGKTASGTVEEKNMPEEPRSPLNTPADGSVTDDLTSDAERELLKALRSTG